MTSRTSGSADDAHPHTSSPRESHDRQPERSGLSPATTHKRETRRRLNVPVFLTAATIIATVALAAALAPSRVASAFDHAVTWTGHTFGSFYIALATAVLVLVIVLALSRFGRVRLGPDHSEPEFSTFSWAAMLFAAGISTDIMFYAVAEPVAQYVSPPGVPGVIGGEGAAPASVAAAREAVVLTLFHYGLHGWGLYALLGMALAYFAYRRGRPLSVREPLRPLLHDRVDGWMGNLIDSAALVGGVFGIATSLGVGIVQLNVGLELVLGIPRGLGTQIALLVAGVTMAALSAVSGVAKGVKILSAANVILAALLAAWVLATGRSAFLVDAIVGNIGDFVRMFPALSLETYAWARPDEWLTSWTLFFWAWWITWAAFVGLFLARISRGRTIREFIVGSLTIPFAYVVMWVGVFGNSALDLVRGSALHGNQTSGAGAFPLVPPDTTVIGPSTPAINVPSVPAAPSAPVVPSAPIPPDLPATPPVPPAPTVPPDLPTVPPDLPTVPPPPVGSAFSDAVLSSPEQGIYALLGTLPGAPLLIALAVAVGLLFYVTSADSGALVMAELSTGSVMPSREKGECLDFAASKQHAETPAAPSPSEANEDPPPDPALGEASLGEHSLGEASLGEALSLQDPPRRLRVFWAAITGALTLAMLLAGGIPVLQAATVVMALPFSVAIIGVAIGLVKELRRCEELPR